MSSFNDYMQHASGNDGTTGRPGQSSGDPIEGALEAMIRAMMGDASNAARTGDAKRARARRKPECPDDESDGEGFGWESQQN